MASALCHRLIWDAAPGEVAAEPHKIYRKRSWAFWQFTTTGSVPGIDGKVDRNIYNGTRGDWDGVLKWLEASR